MIYSRNPISGRNCSGFRFRFNPGSTPHDTLYLPLEMKSLPQIQKLIHGASLLSVFNCHNLCNARKAFNRLRKSYDFDFWAFTEFRIRDIQNPDEIIPLCLNNAQFHIIDIFRKRLFQRKRARYIVSKSVRRCGLTTCIQAYILWMQTCCRPNNSYVCSYSDIGLMQLKSNLCRYLHRDVIPSDSHIFIPEADSRSFFYSFRSPNAIRGINLGFVHLADMARWNDADCMMSKLILRACSGMLLEFFTLVVLEGNIPYRERFSIRRFLRLNPNQSEKARKAVFSGVFKNPFFINEVMVSQSCVDPYFFHIHISSSFS